MDNIEWIMEKLKNIDNRTYEISARLKEDSTRLVDGEEVFITEKSLDGLGRLTIPKAIRQELNIDENTRLKIFRGRDKIIIKRVDK